MAEHDDGQRQGETDPEPAAEHPNAVPLVTVVLLLRPVRAVIAFRARPWRGDRRGCGAREGHHVVHEEIRYFLGG